MKYFSFCLLLLISLIAKAQPLHYTTSNAHSHNDYEQQEPFWLAWKNGFGSIEADIFLHEGKLVVAHQESELINNRSLDSLYLQPIEKVIAENKGFPFADKNKELQLMIDIKTDSVNTLNKLIEVLKNYPAIINNKKIKIAISGNRPNPETWINYPAYIYFDGIINTDYSIKALSKIVMMSENFKDFSRWNGNNSMPQKDKQILISAIKKVHALHKKIRFWNAPDNKIAWQYLKGLEVDYINTDHITQLANFYINH